MRTLVVDEELLHVAHHPQRELGREDAGVLRLVFLEDVGLHGAAHRRQRLGLDPRVGLGIDELVAGDAEQPEAEAVVVLRQLAAVAWAASRRRSVRSTASQPPVARRYFSTCWSMAVFMNIARIIGAGPLIVIETEVVGAQRSKPEYSFFMSSSVAIETPELPILP